MSAVKRETLEIKCRGFVVMYANDPKYKGLDEFLLVKSWQQKTAEHTADMGKATHFNSREEAKQWMELFPLLCGTGHQLPEVRPIWSQTTYTLTDPHQDERVSEFRADIERMVAQRTKDRSY